jgi:Cu(I)/Ag(I) efflux system membrane fusion protein
VLSLSVNFTGQPVEKGQPLFTAYSPEVFTAENEYLLAMQNLRRLSNGSPAELEAARDLMSSARRRFELLEVGGAEIAALEQRGKPSDEIQFRAPLSGHVITKNAVEGKAFMAGETLYEIGHLDHLWVRASVPEYEIGLVKVGQAAKVSVPGGGGMIESRVDFISPHLDPQTRRAEVRVDVENKTDRLRPEMWANVEIEVELGAGLAIPASAVIDTGTRMIAFVDREDEHLEPREIKVSARTDDYLLVTEGLKAGERVVSRALFLVDSESQLKAAIAGMTSAEAPAPAPASDHKH